MTKCAICGRQDTELTDNGNYLFCAPNCRLAQVREEEEEEEETMDAHAGRMAKEALKAADDYALAARHARDEEEENEFGYLAHRAEAEARRWLEVA